MKARRKVEHVIRQEMGRVTKNCAHVKVIIYYNKYSAIIQINTCISVQKYLLKKLGKRVSKKLSYNV